MTTHTLAISPQPAAEPTSLPSLSLVVPVWNDPEGLRHLLTQVTDNPHLHEVIIADASPDDRCASVAREFAAIHVRSPRPNRGAQMNAGAAVATGELLLFHHVDVPITPGHCRAARVSGARSQFSAAAFYREFDSAHARRRWLEKFVGL